LVEQPRIWDDPLPVERPEGETDWVDDLTGVLRHRQRTVWEASQTRLDELVYVLVAGLSVAEMRMEKHRFLGPVLLRGQTRPTLAQGLRVRRDHPGTPGHDA
jgi:hypothetical protein